MLQPQLTRRTDIEALVCRQAKLLSETGAAQLRQRFCAGVAAVYLLSNLIVRLSKREAGACTKGIGRDALDVCALRSL